jgi:hypothetical protein
VAIFKVCASNINSKSKISLRLSIVIQGKLYFSKQGSTLDVLRSVRHNFPFCELILSTWKSEVICDDIKNVCDHIVLNDDPGDETDPADVPININRQIVSSKNGIAVATREYVIKSRTDMIFKSDSIIDYLTNELFREKLIVANFTTRSHFIKNGIPFWVCDFIIAGNRLNVMKYFEVDLYEHDDFNFYKKNKHPKDFQDKSHFYRYSPESYLAISYFAASEYVEHSYDRNFKSMNEYDKVLMCKLVVLNKWELGVDSLKYYLPFNSHQLMLSSFKFKKFFNNNSTVKFQYNVTDFYDLYFGLYNRVLKRRFK